MWQKTPVSNWSAFGEAYVTSTEHTVDEIAQIMGRHVDKFRLMGATREDTGHVEKHNLWETNSDIEGDWDLSDEIIKLLDRLDIKKPLLANCTVEFYCTVYLAETPYCTTPAMYLEKEIIQELASINASFDTDIYELQ